LHRQITSRALEIKIQKYYKINVEKKQRDKRGYAYMAPNEYCTHKILVSYFASTMRIGFWWERNHYEDLDVGGRITLK
jgi:hypothetical protein